MEASLICENRKSCISSQSGTSTDSLTNFLRVEKLVHKLVNDIICILSYELITDALQVIPYIATNLEQKVSNCLKYHLASDERIPGTFGLLAAVRTLKLATTKPVFNPKNP